MSGSILTSAGTRIRNVRVGDVYKDYAYYGDNGQNASPKFYALNINTGAETLLGNAGTLIGTGSFGVWTVLERGGYLYVQTTDNGIQVYPMTSATALGPILTTYTKERLDAVGLITGQQYGLDVMPDGSRFILGVANGKVAEFGGPDMRILNDGTFSVLSWSSSVNGVVLQSSPSLSPAAFADVDPQPYVLPDGKTNSAWVPLVPGQSFFRLRRTP